MWSDGRDVNEAGERILLLQPIVEVGQSLHQKRNRMKIPDASPSLSHIGGSACFHGNDSSIGNLRYPSCTICNRSMHLLLQLNAPLDDLDRTLYVFGCNNSSCHTSDGGNPNDSKFRPCFGGSSIRCFRSQSSWRSSACALDIETSDQMNDDKLEDNDWGDDDWVPSAINEELGVNEGTTDKSKELSMDDLEEMISKCEMKSKNIPTNGGNMTSSTSKTKGTPSSKNRSTAKICAETNEHSFSHYNLEWIEEPPAARNSESGNVNDDDDDDDDDLETFSGIESSKINQMLSSYLAMEEDEDILSAIKRGGKIDRNGTNSTGKIDQGGERYERLPPEEHAFLEFSNRLKRAPQQVVRYGYGGIPLWSIPHQKPHEMKQNSRGKSNQHKTSTSTKDSFPEVPPCICGSRRIFEFQLLPSLLHVLEVDYSSSETKSENKTDDLMDLMSAGGMNWGSIAVYVCAESCNESREEFCIVQNADEAPLKQMDASSFDGTDDDSVECFDIRTQQNLS